MATIIMHTVDTSDLHARIITAVSPILPIKTHPLAKVARRVQGYAHLMVSGKYTEAHRDALRELAKEIIAINNAMPARSQVREQCHTLLGLVSRMGQHYNAVLDMRAAAQEAVVA